MIGVVSPAHNEERDLEQCLARGARWLAFGFAGFVE